MGRKLLRKIPENTSIASTNFDFSWKRKVDSHYALHSVDKTLPMNASQFSKPVSEYAAVEAQFQAYTLPMLCCDIIHGSHSVSRVL